MNRDRRYRKRERETEGHEWTRDISKESGGAAIVEPIVIIPIRHRPSVPPSFPSSSNRVQQRETLSGRIDCPPSAVSAVHEWPNSVNSGFSLKLSISARSALHCSPLPPPASLFSHRNIKSLLLLLLDKSHQRRRRRRMLPERGAKSIMMPNDI